MLDFANKMLRAIDDEGEMLDTEAPESNGILTVLRRLKYLVTNEIDDYIDKNGGANGLSY
jgi:hypothetical protein